MIEYRVASKDDMDLVIKSRLEMLRVVNGLSEDYVFEDELVACSKAYFECGDQTTVLAVENEVIGCATMCYLEMMPTFSHPTGRRAHLMNVYTQEQFRGNGIGSKMMEILLSEAKKKGVTEVSLDATELGRPLYKKFGFIESEECMVLVL